MHISRFTWASTARAALCVVALVGTNVGSGRGAAQEVASPVITEATTEAGAAEARGLCGAQVGEIQSAAREHRRTRVAVVRRALVVYVERLRRELGTCVATADGAGTAPPRDVLEGGAVTGSAADVLAQAEGVGVAGTGSGTLRDPSGGGRVGTGGDLGGVATVGPPEHPTGAGHFDPQVVVRAVSTRRSAVQACYERELRTHATLAGRITIQMTIQEAGTVTGVQAIANTTGNETVASCVSAIVAGLRFRPGPTGGSVTYTFPFVFEPATAP